MIKTLVRHGEDWALVFDKELLDLLELDADTPLEITTDGRSLRIAPSDPARPEKFEAAMRETLIRYAGVFRRLAE